MTLAFFDLDKTLIFKNSATLWVQNEYFLGNISLFELILGSYWLLKYRLGFTNIEDMIKKSALSLKGKDSREFIKRTGEFYERSIKNLYRPGALKTLKEHREKKHKLVLLTSAIDILSVHVAKDLNFDYCLSSKLEIDKEQKFTGYFVGEPCFGPQKIVFAKNLAKSLNMPLETSYFYTDSASDIPLLNLVKNPKVINPDMHLYIKAKCNNWPILDWGK